MAESQVEKKQKVNSLAIILISVVTVAAVFCAALNFVYPGFVNLLVGKTYVSGGSIYDAIFVVLTVAADVLYSAHCLVTQPVTSRTSACLGEGSSFIPKRLTSYFGVNRQRFLCRIRCRGPS